MSISMLKYWKFVKCQKDIAGILRCFQGRCLVNTVSIMPPFYTVFNGTVNVLNFRPLVACQKVLDKQGRPDQTASAEAV